MIKLLRLATVAVVCGFVIACADQAPEMITPVNAATELYHNGKIVTMDPAQPEVQAVAVRDGIILAAGTLSEVEAAAAD